MKNQALVALLMIAFLAGCAKPSETTDSGAPATSGAQGSTQAPVQAPPTSGSPEGAVQTVGSDNAFLMQAQSGKDGPIRSFAWTIPAGAIHEEQPFIGLGEDFKIRILYLDFLPVFAEGKKAADVSDYMFGAIRVGDNAQLSDLMVGTTFTETQYDIVAGPQTQTFQSTFGPRIMAIYAGDLEEGNQLVFFTAMKSVADMPVSLLVKVHKGDLRGHVVVETNQTAFLSNKTLVELPVKGQGAGFQVSEYFWSQDFFPPFAFSYESLAGPVQVTDAWTRQEPLPLPRDVTLSTSFPKEGYSDASGYFFASSEDGTWSANVDLHGTGGQPHSVMADPGLIFGGGQLVTGYPDYFAINEGSGAASSTFHLQNAMVPNQFNYQFLMFAQLDIGATFKTLAGVAAETGYSDGLGLAGNIPPSHFARAGDDLVVFQGDRMMRYAGAAHGLAGDRLVELGWP